MESRSHMMRPLEEFPMRTSFSFEVPGPAPDFSPLGSPNRWSSDYDMIRHWGLAITPFIESYLNHFCQISDSELEQLGIIFGKLHQFHHVSMQLQQGSWIFYLRSKYGRS
jgi:hypothetical protein